MSHTIEIPDTLYAALREAADQRGTTSLGWIASQLARSKHLVTPRPEPAGPKTLAELFAGRVGRIRSGGHLRLSEDCAEKLTDHLEAKQEAGHL